MADTSTIVVGLTAGILGLISVVLGFAAEATKIQVSEIYYSYTYGGCVHPESPAYGLAIAAAIFLLTMQIILSILMGCCGCCKTGRNLAGASNILAYQASTKRTYAILMICISKVAFVISFILFLAGARANTPGGFVDNNCYTVKPGIFAGASILSLITVGTGVTAYFFLRSSNFGPAVVMANPQYPQAGANPGIPMGNVQPQQGYGYAQEAPKPTQSTQQNYYPPPGNVPAGYGYNTQTNM